MIVEGIMITLAVALIFFGLGVGYLLGKEVGDKAGYRRGFDEGVDFARGEGLKQRDRPVYSHLRPVDS